MSERLSAFGSFGFCISLWVGFCFGHSGRTESNGCHRNRKTGEYHCHTPSNLVTSNLDSSHFSAAECPVVGNTNSYIYHVAGGQFYNRMLARNSDVENRKCFESEYQAESAGFRKSRR